MKAVARWHSGAATDAGLRRAGNEDRVYADDTNGVFLVVDGLGGHAGGEMAAQTAVDVIAAELNGAAGDAERRARSTITRANNEIFRLAQANPELRGMACVLALAIAHGDTVTAAHVGDSRLYLVWNRAVRKLTSDHSPIGEQEDDGTLSEVEAMAHPRRHEVFRDVGSRLREPDDDQFIETRSFVFRREAALLLCTDGLSDALTSAEIGAIAESYDGDAGRVAESLVEAANQRGGNDNVSVIFVPGPDYGGGNSASLGTARARHGITRMRRRKRAWKRLASPVLGLIIGAILGALLWATVGRYVEKPPGPPPPKISVPRAPAGAGRAAEAP